MKRKGQEYGRRKTSICQTRKKKRKFDISSPMGIIVGFAIVIAAIVLSGGGIKAFKNFLDIPSILIVIGGTAATIVVAYRFGEIKNIRKVFLLFYIEEKKIQNSQRICSLIFRKSLKRMVYFLQKLMENKQTTLLFKGDSFNVKWLR